MRLKKYPPYHYRVKRWFKDYTNAIHWTARRRDCRDPELMKIYIEFSRFWAAQARNSLEKIGHDWL